MQEDMCTLAEEATKVEDEEKGKEKNKAARAERFTSRARDLDCKESPM